VTIRKTIQEAGGLFEYHHIPNPRLTAEVLLAYVLSTDRTYLYTHDERELSTYEFEAFRDCVARRSSGVPLQYITGVQEFYGRPFKVTSDVLIPRPETENIIGAIRETRPGPGTRIVDVGTGSGCIAITLALEINGADVVATDISEDALRVARQNARTLKAAVEFAAADLLDSLTGEFDFIACNPPYVPRGDLASLQREVRDHEPHIALFSPDDELAIYRRLIPDARERLKPGGRLVMEIGMGMEERVLAVFNERWRKLPTRDDLQGIPRTVIAERI
jgi:release factor glutamine methyltransferase